MPVDYSKYPKTWKTEIRPRILARARHRCERCGAENHSVIMRNQNNKDEYLVLRSDGCYYTPEGICIRLSELPEGYFDASYIKVVLTIAHIHDHDPMACDDDNLLALCQKCHLALDHPRHVQKAKETRIKKKQKRMEATGQLSLWGEDE